MFFKKLVHKTATATIALVTNRFAPVARTAASNEVVEVRGGQRGGDLPPHVPQRREGRPFAAAHDFVEAPRAQGLAVRRQPGLPLWPLLQPPATGRRSCPVFTQNTHTVRGLFVETSASMLIGAAREHIPVRGHLYIGAI